MALEINEKEDQIIDPFAYCDICDEPISEAEDKENDGLCDACAEDEEAREDGTYEDEEDYLM